MHFDQVAKYSARLAFTGAFVCWTTLLIAQTPPPEGYSLVGPLNFIGAQYESYNGASSTLQFVNTSGEVAGSSSRYATSAYITSPIGQDVWLFDGTSVIQLGLLGGVYAGTNQQSNLVGLNNLGQATGYSYRVSNSAQGTDAWFYNGMTTQQIGLTGAGYEGPGNGSGPDDIFEDSQPILLNNSGDVAGISWRLDSKDDSLGQDTWYFNGTTTQQIGFYGTGYQYTTSGGGVYAQSEPQLINDLGEVAGISTRYDSAGNQIPGPAWLFNGNSTLPLGLTGPGYQYNYTGPGGGVASSSAVVAMNNAGDVLGNSTRYSSTGTNLGNDIWLFDGTSTQQIGLIGGQYQYVNTSGGTVENGTAIAMNKSGEVIGRSIVYSGTEQAGSDAWIYNGSTTQKIGLTGAAYVNQISGGISNSPYLINTAGAAVGSTARLSAIAGGTDTWFFNGTSTQEIGLTGGIYQYTSQGAVFRTSSLVALSDTNDVVGTSDRYSAGGGNLGQDAWFFDPNSDTTYPLDFSVSSSGYAMTDPEVLTSSGVVLGYYDLYNGSTNIGDRAFWWSETAGFHDLGTLVNGGLSVAGWSDLANAMFSVGQASSGSSTYIVGSGVFLNNGMPDDGIYELAVNVPEPAISAIVLVAVWPVLLRRRPR
jgi:hypothetical protein